MIAYISVSNFNFPNIRKTQTNEFRGLPGSPVAGACALCGDAEGAGLSKSGGRAVSRGPKAASLLSAGKVLRRHFTMVHLGGIRGRRCRLKQETFGLDKRRNFISKEQ